MLEMPHELMYSIRHGWIFPFCFCLIYFQYTGFSYPSGLFLLLPCEECLRFILSMSFGLKTTTNSQVMWKKIMTNKHYLPALFFGKKGYIFYVSLRWHLIWLGTWPSLPGYTPGPRSWWSFNQLRLVWGG